MSGIVEIIQRIVKDELSRMYIAEIGEVTSIYPHSGEGDKENYECNVQLKNRDLELRGVPVATQHIGLAHIPKVDDLVLLNFLNGDINAPIIVGRLYNDADRPPVSQGEEVVYIPPYSEDSDLRRVHMELPSGLLLQVTDDFVDVKAGGTQVKINRDGDVYINSANNVQITGAEDMEIKAKNLKIETEEAFGLTVGKAADISVTEKLSIAGQQDVALDAGMNLAQTAGANYELSSGLEGKMDFGTIMNMKAGLNATVEASVMMTVKGAVLQLNP